MAQILGLPKLSPTMEEGVLVRWTKKEGDKVSPGDLIAEVETDKANMDFNVEDEGVLLKFLVKEGETVKLGAPVAIIGKAGEDVSALESQAKAAPVPRSRSRRRQSAKPRGQSRSQSRRRSRRRKPEPRPSAEASDAKPAAKPEPAKAEGGNADAAPGKLLASPLAKTLAIELGIDLRTVTGIRTRRSDRRARCQSRRGRRRDQAAPKPDDGARPSKPSRSRPRPRPRSPCARRAARIADGDFTTSPTSNMRKRIAQRLTEASRDIPQFYLMRTLDVAPLLGFRERLNTLLGDKGKVSVNDLIIKAVALALRRVPECNASWEGDAIRHYHRVHIGVAVAIEDGLVTPVDARCRSKGHRLDRRGGPRPRRPREEAPVEGSGDHRLDVHGVEPRHVRDRAVHRDPQSARGRHPRDRRHGRHARSCRTARSSSASA